MKKIEVTILLIGFLMIGLGFPLAIASIHVVTRIIFIFVGIIGIIIYLSWLNYFIEMKNGEQRQ